MFILGLLTGLVIGLLLYVALTIIASLGNRKSQDEMHEESMDACNEANRLRGICNDKLEALAPVALQPTATPDEPVS